VKKIISLFQRNYDGDRLVRDEIVPGAEWVIAGEGVATRKWDGTCCMCRDGKWYKRYDAKRGKLPPPDFEPAQDYDEVGHMPGWVPVNDGPADQWHREAIPRATADGTFELIGPKINGNPERKWIAENCDFSNKHYLIRHGVHELADAPRNYEAIREYFRAHDIEGIVWHHADGRMVKIKAKDFGVKRGG